MDQDRLKRWIYASHAVGGAEQSRAFMMVAVQGLARIDCQLIATDEWFISLSEEQRADIQLNFDLTERITLSYLWVLGAYEILRALDQWTRAASHCGPQLGAARITKAKHLFERVRIPLAKFEASRRSPEDSPVAYPAIHPQHGIAWLIADNTVVTRRQLSDTFPSLFSELRALRDKEAEPDSVLSRGDS